MKTSKESQVTQTHIKVAEIILGIFFEGTILLFFFSFHLSKDFFITYVITNMYVKSLFTEPYKASGKKKNTQGTLPHVLWFVMMLE